MSSHSKYQSTSQCKIKDVEATDEKITGRGGLNLFVRYLEEIGVMQSTLLPLFEGLRKNGKDTPVDELFKQVLCNFMDGTSRHLSYFDQLRQDKSYANVLESEHENLASSHTVKRFYQDFTWPMIESYRSIYLDMFIWRLFITKPEAVILDLDAMVMDNDQAEKREGVKPTYKKRKGFNALQLTWDGFLVDSELRSGEKHSNFGQSVQYMLRRAIQRIRSSYSQDVPIVIHMDAGFMDKKIFRMLEELEVGFICGGKLYKDITTSMSYVPDKAWNRYYGSRDVHDNQIWEYFEFGDRRESWNRFRRAIFTRPMSENGQILLPFVRPCQVIYTNIGQGYAIDNQLQRAGLDWLLKTEGLIKCYHQRGESELTFRSFKDFGSEQLPFKKFQPNAAYYHCMVLAFNLYEAFKEDVCADVVSVGSYPETMRRKIIDIGVRVVKRSRKFILKIPEAIFTALDFSTLWVRCNNPPRLIVQ